MSEFLLLNAFPNKLHRGEASSLAVAIHRKWLFLTDDRAARKEGLRHGIQISGTLGCLVIAIERNVLDITKGNQYLRAMIANGYFSPVYDLRDLVGDKAGI